MKGRKNGLGRGGQRGTWDQGEERQSRDLLQRFFWSHYPLKSGQVIINVCTDTHGEWGSLPLTSCVDMLSVKPSYNVRTIFHQHAHTHFSERANKHVIAVYCLAGLLPFRYAIIWVNILKQTVFNKLHRLRLARHMALWRSLIQQLTVTKERED